MSKAINLIGWIRRCCRLLAPMLTLALVACQPGVLVPTPTSEVTPTGGLLENGGSPASSTPLATSLFVSPSLTPTASPSATATSAATQAASELLAQSQFPGARAVAWSPAADLIALATDGGINLLHPVTLEPEGEFETEFPLTDLVFNRQGTRLAAYGEGVTVFEWNMESGELLAEYGRYINLTFLIQYDNLGNLYIAIDNGPAESVSVLILDPQEEEGFASFRNLKSHDPLAISPSGEQLAYQRRGPIKIYASGQEEAVFEIETRSSFGLEYSPEGLHLAAAENDCSLNVYDTTTGEKLSSTKWCESPDQLPPRSFTGPGNGLDFSPDGAMLAVANHSGSIHVWDWANEEQVAKFTIPERITNSLSFSPDATRLASIGEDGLLQIWAIEP